MAADLQQIDESMPIPDGLTIHSVHDVEMMREWIGVWLFPEGLDAMRADYLTALAGLGFATDRPLCHYVGRLDGKPVACVALFFAEGVASVQYVVTLSAFRRQGIGAAMTLAALREARTQGYRVAVLTSSPFGYNIYHRLGFRPYITMSTYGWEPN
jgi:GNAT superfamily N-acetyltransferase